MVNSTAKTYPAQVEYSNIYPTLVPRNCKGITSNATVAPALNLRAEPGPGWGSLIGTATLHPPSKAGQKGYAQAIENTYYRPGEGNTLHYLGNALRSAGDYQAQRPS